MMAMYKLFHIIHKRTDFEDIVLMMDKLMRPEYYAALHDRIQNVTCRLSVMSGIMQTICHNSYQW